MITPSRATFKIYAPTPVLVSNYQSSSAAPQLSHIRQYCRSVMGTALMQGATEPHTQIRRWQHPPSYTERGQCSTIIRPITGKEGVQRQQVTVIFVRGLAVITSNVRNATISAILRRAPAHDHSPPQ
jgi:hypothetical protein